MIFVEIVNDIEPNLKKVRPPPWPQTPFQVFGVDRAPKATMQKMPKFGGHVARVTDFLDQVSSSSSQLTSIFTVPVDVHAWIHRKSDGCLAAGEEDWAQPCPAIVTPPGEGSKPFLFQFSRAEFESIGEELLRDCAQYLYGATGTVSDRRQGPFPSRLS